MFGTLLTGIENNVNNLKSSLQQLTIPMHDQNSYQALSQLRFDNLSKLTICISMEVNEESGLHLGTFLKINCPSLVSLVFEFLFNSSFSKDFPNGLPELLNLKHFGYHFVPSNRTIQESPHFLKLDNMSLSPTKFNSLHSISTNLGVCLYMARNRHNRPYGRWYNNPFYINHINFPTVSTLTLTLSVINYAEGSISVKDNMNQLHLLYPNLRQVIIDNQMPPSNRYYKGQSQKEILRAMLQELIGIIHLEVLNYYDDWLTELLLESSDLNSTVKSLVSLKLESIEKNFRRRYPILNFNILLTCMSNLRLLEVKEEYLTTECKTQKEIQDKLRDLHWLFPNLKIEMI